MKFLLFFLLLSCQSKTSTLILSYEDKGYKKGQSSSNKKFYIQEKKMKADLNLTLPPQGEVKVTAYYDDETKKLVMAIHSLKKILINPDFSKVTKKPIQMMGKIKKDLGEKRQINNWKCQDHHQKDENGGGQISCMSDFEQLGISLQEAATFSGLHKVLMKAIGLEPLEGFQIPITSKVYENKDQLVSESILVSISREESSENLFVPPVGYEILRP